MRTRVHGKQQTGFTLVELMIVIAVIGILAAVAIPSLKVHREKALIGSATETGHQILTAFTAHAATSPDNLFPSGIDSSEDLLGVLAENGLILTEEQLRPFRDSAGVMDLIEVCYRCWYDTETGELACEPIDCPEDFFGAGTADFSLQIALLGIDRPLNEQLVLEVHSIKGVKIHTGWPEI